MGVDVGFELEYLLSDVLGAEAKVESYSYSDEGLLCLEVVVNGARKSTCIPVKQCKGIPSQNKRWKCVIRALSDKEELLQELRKKLLNNV